MEKVSGGEWLIEYYRLHMTNDEYLTLLELHTSFTR
jgi:hypothetical protein